MEHAGKKELLGLINKQKEDLLRYKTRLSDIVTAYKGLMKEKEALEASLKAFNKNDSPQSEPRIINELSETEESNKSESEEPLEAPTQLKTQITTLMNSLATLSAEKSRMEAGFQADKRQLRSDIEQRERKIKEQEERLQEIKRNHGIELEEVKSKLIIERHDREKEQSDHAAMIKELQKLLSDERRAREGLEIRLAEIESSEGDPNDDTKSLTDPSPEPSSNLLFNELQQEMTRLKNQHEAAIQEEKRRQAELETRARRLAAAHEKRVASLEARLAELSKTVGDYDRLRQQDQQAIHKLKERLSQLDRDFTEVSDSNSEGRSLKNNLDYQDQDVQTLIERILLLKDRLISINERAKNPLDVFAILNAEGLFLKPKDSHASCQEAYDKLEREFELYKNQYRFNITNNRQEDAAAEASLLHEQISRLQTRNRTLSAQLEECQNEARSRLNEQHNLLKADRAKLNERLRATEAEWRSRVAELDQQIHSQRERSLRLLEEKEQEISTLKSAFAMFVPGHKNNSPNNIINGENLDQKAAPFVSPADPSSVESNPHMLHYAHELARKDVELGQARRARLRLEGQLREAKRDAATEAEKHKREVKTLSEEVARLERCQSRESANLEYLKNVFVSYLSSRDTERKRHMLNAIAAVLRFSDSELERLSYMHLSS